MDITSWNENSGEPRVWKLTSAVRGRAGGKGPSHRYLACCLSYYDLGEPLPDHSSLTRIRERYGVEVFRRFFEKIVELCQQAGLVWGRELYIDGTKIEANASLDSLKPRFAIEAHLVKLFAEEVEQPTEEGQQTLRQAEATESRPPEQPETQVPMQLPTSLSAEEREALAQSNAARHDWLEQLGAQNRSATSRSYQRMADLLVSTTDADATVMQTGHGSDMGYRTHYVVDGGKERIILAALVTPFEVTDNQPMLDLIWRARFRWKLWPGQVTGDTKYGTTDNIVAIGREHISAYVPIADLTQRTPYFRQEDFQYDSQRDVYICPAGKELHFCQRQTTERSRRYRARAKDCNHCPLKAQCTTSTQGRSLCRSTDELYLDRIRAYHHTEAYKKALRKRSVWVEPLFAEGKQWHGMRRFRLRRLWRVNCEALMCAAGQNLKRLLKKRGWGRRPSPAEAVSVLVLASYCWLTHASLESMSVSWLIGLFYPMNKRKCLPLTDEL